MSSVKNRKEMRITDSLKFGLLFLFRFQQSTIENTDLAYKLDTITTED